MYSFVLTLCCQSFADTLVRNDGHDDEAVENIDNAAAADDDDDDDDE